MSKIDLSNVDIDAIVAELQQTINTLEKSNQDQSPSLSKKEESSKEESSKEESSKEESSKEDKKAPPSELNKEEGSSYESQAPEASSDQQPPMDDQQPDQVEAIEEVLKLLPPDKLQDLMAKVQQELANRPDAGQPDQGQPPAEQNAPALDQPPQPDQSAALKAEKEEAFQKLAKAEQENTELKKLVESLSFNLNKILSKPQPKVITDINSVSLVPRGLAKSDLSPSEIDQKIKAITSDRSKLAKLTKSQMDAVVSYRFDKKLSNEILEIIK